MNGVFQVAAWRVERNLNRLSCGSKVVQLEPKAMEVLVYLAEHHGEVLPRSSIMAAVWSGTHVCDEVLTYCISELRKAFEDDARRPSFIETIPRRGYRLIAPVSKPVAKPVAPPEQPALTDAAPEPQPAASEPPGILPAAAAPEPAPAPGTQEVLPLAAVTERHPAVAVGPAAAHARRGWLYWGTGAGAACVALVLLFWYQPWSPALGETDSVLLTDFENRAGEPVFDGTLKHALAMHLGQTPFFNIFPEEWVRETLRYMGRAADEHVGLELGREICLRRGIKAMLGGSIAKLGRTYVISLEALNGHTGEVIAREQVQAASEEQVLQELGKGATNLRRKLGESLKSIERFDVPLEQATTRSLAAFNAYSAGRRKLISGLTSEAIPHYQRALEADPNFASAYDDLAWCYAARSDSGMAAECATKAYALRDRVSEYERLSIDTIYCTMVTDEKIKAIETLEMMRTVYPRSPSVRNTLGNMYADTGQFQKAEAAYREAIRLRRYPNAYGGLGWVCFRLNRVKEAKEVLAEAAEQGIDNRSLRSLRYNIAFSEGDRGAMIQQVQWALGKPGEAFMLALQGDAAAYTGRLDEARTFYRQAIEAAGKHQLKNAAAQFAASAALWEACGGNCDRALQYLGSTEPGAAYSGLGLRYALALALCGKADQAAALADGVDSKCSGQAWARQSTLPVIRAAVALSRGESSAALVALGVPSQRPAWNALWPRYLAGEAYRRLGTLKEARAEYQYVLSHLSLEALSPLCALARLGLARAEAAAGDNAATGKAYQELFSHWKRADSDLPLFRQALAEYSSRTTRAQK